MTINSDPQLNDADLELLSAYIDHQLDERERAALEQRLSQEPALRGVLDELRATVGLLHELEPIRPPRSFTIAAPAAAPRRFWSFPWRAIGSALVALVCLLTFSYALIRGSSSGGAAAPAAAPAPAAMEAAAPTQAAVAGGAAPSSAMRQLATTEPAAAAPTAAPAAEAPTAAPAEAPAAPMAAADNAAPTAAAEAPMAAQAALPSPAPTAAAGGAAPIATAQPAAAAPAPAGAALKSTDGPITQPYSSALVATSEISSPGTVTLDQPPIAPTANSAPSGGSSSLRLAAGIVVLVLIVGGIGLALRRRQRR